MACIRRDILWHLLRSGQRQKKRAVLRQYFSIYVEGPVTNMKILVMSGSRARYCEKWKGICSSPTWLSVCWTVLPMNKRVRRLIVLTWQSAQSIVRSAACCKSGLSNSYAFFQVTETSHGTYSLWWHIYTMALVGLCGVRSVAGHVTLIVLLKWNYTACCRALKPNRLTFRYQDFAWMMVNNSDRTS